MLVYIIAAAGVIATLAAVYYLGRSTKQAEVTRDTLKKTVQAVGEAHEIENKVDGLSDADVAAELLKRTRR
jgi:hypothetical protein